MPDTVRGELELNRGEVHVWLADLDDSRLSEPLHRGALSPAEVARAARFRDATHGTRFTSGRFAIRSILGAYLSLNPGEVALEFASRGKPFVSTTAIGELYFNLTHSNGLMAFAVTSTARIGIDLEHLREVPDSDDIALRLFAPGEREAIAGYESRERSAAFLRCWTRKEAYVKACGDGIGVSLDSFEVDVSETANPRILRIGDDSAAAERWTLRSFSPTDQTIGAIAVETTGIVVTIRNWPV